MALAEIQDFFERLPPNFDPSVLPDQLWAKLPDNARRRLTLEQIRRLTAAKIAERHERSQTRHPEAEAILSEIAVCLVRNRQS